jgi:type IV secretory pathway protease TraF
MESFAADGDGPEVLPALLIPIAVQMTAAAAEALALYWLDHHGAAFQKDEAVKAMVVAMGVSLVPFMAEVKYLGHLAPVAAKILAVAPAFDAVSIAKAAVPMIGEIVLALREIWKERKAAKGV